MKMDLKVTNRVMTKYGLDVEEAQGTITVLAYGKPLNTWHYDIGFGGPSRQDVMKNDVQPFILGYIDLTDSVRKAKRGKGFRQRQEEAKRVFDDGPVR